MRVPGYRALALAWAVVAGLGLGGVSLLAWLGPPAPPAAEASPAAPPAGPVEAAPPARAETAIAEPRAPAAATPAPVPSAPEPPPLAQPETRRGAAEPVIAPPDPGLQEASRHGPVPRLGPGNSTAIRAFARPFDRDDPRPRIGLILGGIGLNAQHSEEAIRRLPGAVTLAFSPYALRPEPLAERARARGMEMLSALPLEPAGFPGRADPGERALLTGLSAVENGDRLLWALSRLQGQVGAIGAEGAMRGERFAANAELLGGLQAALHGRGLLFVDARPGAAHPARAFGRAVDLVLDEPPTRGEVERRLAELEQTARANRSALGYAGDPVPSVVGAILAWSAGLEARGAVIAPVSVLIRRPADQAGR
jgi:polysaccharide deacetylase 2 family uncharacterized protein YibQ